MLAGVEHETVIKMSPGVPDPVAAFEDDMRYVAPLELARRCQSGRSGPDHHGVHSHSVFRYSMSARRFSSVLMRGQTSCPRFDEPGRVTENQSRFPPNLRKSSVSFSPAYAGFVNSR